MKLNEGETQVYTEDFFILYYKVKLVHEIGHRTTCDPVPGWNPLYSSAVAYLRSGAYLRYGQFPPPFIQAYVMSEAFHRNANISHIVGDTENHNPLASTRKCNILMQPSHT